MSDEEIESKVHDAVVEETETRHNSKSKARFRVRITINEIGEGFITKKHLPKNVQLPDGTPLSVEIKKHESTERWLVSKIISIDGEPYTSPEPEPKKEKAEPKPKPEKRKPKPKPKQKISKLFKDIQKGISSCTNLDKTTLLKYWEQNIKFSLHDYPVNPLITIEDDRLFEGYFIQTFAWVEGYQGHVWCEELDSLVFVNYDHGKKSGSFVLGAKVSFTVIVVDDNKGKPSFKANRWSSNRTRTLPEAAYSINHKDLDEKHEEIVEYLDRNIGPVVVVAPRSLDSFKRKQELKLSHILEKVEINFPGYNIEKFDPYDASKHPFLNENTYGAILIFPNKNDNDFSNEILSSLTVVNLKQICRENGLKVSGLKNEIIERILEKLQPNYVLNESEIEQCIVGVTQIIHDQQIANRKGWVILGDETGKLLEFKGKKSGRKSRMLWVVVPPDCDLPPLHPNFHGSDIELFGGDLEQAMHALFIHSDKVKTFIFSYEEGDIPSSVNELPYLHPGHLMMWQLTLPLVMEYVLSNSKSEESASIYIERLDGELSQGTKPLATMILEFADSYRYREIGGKLSFSDTRILAKNPNEHGWLAYSDALGHILNENFATEEMKSSAEKLMTTTYSVPYRQESLNLSIRTALKNLATPLVFLKSLSDISKKDIRDYVRPFFGGAIIEARDSLSNSEWQKLFEHFKNTAEIIDGQHAAEMIVANLDVDSMVDIFPKEMEKYIFLKSVLGSSNHVGTTKVANKCKVYIDELLDNGLKLSKREKKKLKTLQAGANDNQFDWAHITDFDELAEDADQDDVLDWDEETQHYFGSQALSRALRNNITDLDEALEIENKLRSIHQKDWEYRRRYIYYSELLMMKSEFEEAKRVLEIEFPNHIGEDDNKSHLSDSYYLASLLKACALSSSTELFQEYSKLVLKSLDEKHPSQRIAYWYSRWVNQLLQSEPQEFVDKIDLSILESCLAHLLSLKNYDFFKKEAPGVILACELIDLNKRGLIEEEHESFLEQVLANSEVFANEWVENNYPNEEDWLAPLNFNYR